MSVERIDTLNEIAGRIDALRNEMLFPENEAWERGLECYPDGMSSHHFLMALAVLEQAHLHVKMAITCERG